MGCNIQPFLRFIYIHIRIYIENKLQNKWWFFSWTKQYYFNTIWTTLFCTRPNIFISKLLFVEEQWRLQLKLQFTVQYNIAVGCHTVIDCFVFVGYRRFSHTYRHWTIALNHKLYSYINNIRSIIVNECVVLRSIQAFSIEMHKPE